MSTDEPPMPTGSVIATLLRYDSVKFAEVVRGQSRFHGCFVGFEEQGLGNWVEVDRLGVGGVFVDSAAPDCPPYPDVEARHPLPRDRWAGALNEAIEEVGDKGLFVAIVDGWLIAAVASRRDQAVEPSECASFAAMLAPRLLAALGRDAGPVYPPPPSEAKAPVYRSTVSVYRSTVSAVDPVSHSGLSDSAQIVRVYKRTFLSAEEPPQLYVSKPLDVQFPSTTSQFKMEEVVESSPLLGDDAAIGLRLKSRLGDLASALDTVAVVDGQLVIAGAPDRDGLRDEEIFSASKLLLSQSNELFASPGLHFLAELDLGEGLRLDAIALSNLSVYSQFSSSQISVAGPGQRGAEIGAVWATRSVPGQRFLLEVDHTGVQVIESASDALIGALVGEIEPRVEMLSPSTWIATADLLVAVGTHKRRPSKRKAWYRRLLGAQARQVSPKPWELSGVFRATADALGNDN